MKILLCTPYEPEIKKNAGGIAVWAKNVIDYYKKHTSDADVEVLPYNRTIYVHEGLNKIVRLYKGATDYINLLLLTRRRLKKERFDVVHLCSSALWSIVRDYIVMLMAKRYGAAGVIHFHCGRIPGLAKAKNWRWRILKKVVEIAGATIVLDQQSYDVLTVRGYKNIHKVPNPLSEAMCDRIKELSNNVSRISRRILFVGHVLPSKGVYELAEASVNIPNVEVRLLGRVEEPVKSDLLKINPKLEFLGEQSHDVVLEEMLACDAFVFPSYTEGFPNVVLEAMACGTPIVASSVGAIAEMLNDGDCGVLIEPRSTDAVYKAVVELLGNEAMKKRLSEKACYRVKEMYSMPSVWENLINVWNSAK